MCSLFVVLEAFSKAMATANGSPPKSLFDVLSNYLILRLISPYIGCRSLVSLAATSKAFNCLIYGSPQVFQHVDLSGIDVSKAHPLIVSEELFVPFYRSIFSCLENRNVIYNVRTLVLDDLYVPTTIIEDILFNERFQIRLLSLRTSNLRDKSRTHDLLRKLFLFHLVNKSGPSSLKLKGLYIFGELSKAQTMSSCSNIANRAENPNVGVTTSVGAQLGAGHHSVHEPDDSGKVLVDGPYADSPYGAFGQSKDLRYSRLSLDWSKILEAGAGLISFDAVLCRHNRASVPGLRIASVRLAGCESCGTCPEGPAYPGISPIDHLPLLSPPPLHSSKVEVAQRLDTNGQPYPPLIVRCHACLAGRWCKQCNVWWCESCYTIPKTRVYAKEDAPSGPLGTLNENIKVYNGLCVSKCLVEELLSRGGEGGMWG